MISGQECLHCSKWNSKHIVILSNEMLIRTRPSHENRCLRDVISMFAKADVIPEHSWQFHTNHELVFDLNRISQLKRGSRYFLTSFIRIFQQEFFHQSILIGTKLFHQISNCLFFDIGHSKHTNLVHILVLLSRTNLSHNVNGFTVLLLAINCTMIGDWLVEIFT